MIKEGKPDINLGFANGNVNVVADIGNARAKLATDIHTRMADRLNVDHFTHAIAEIARADYDELCYRFRERQAWHFIAWEGRYFIVGDDVFHYNPTFDPKRGRLKYSKDYYGILFIAGLLRLFGNGIPEKVNALLAHPPADLALRESLMRSVVGKWRFESNGVKHVVHIPYANVFDEIAGGLINATTAPDGELYSDMKMDGQTLVFDLGGGTLDLALADNGKINYSRIMDSTRSGANTAINAFKRDFDVTHSDLVSNYEDGIPRDTVHQIFLHPDHILELAAGDVLDCTRMYQRAINPVIATALDSVRKFAGNMMGIRRVLLDGGVSGLMYDEISKQVFPAFLDKGAILLADKRADMLKANARGGIKLLEGLKTETRRRAKERR